MRGASDCTAGVRMKDIPETNIAGSIRAEATPSCSAEVRSPGLGPAAVIDPGQYGWYEAQEHSINNVIVLA